MQVVDDYVEPLSGEEIVIDLCEQIAAKLRNKQQDNPDELLHTDLEIPVEPALNVVRERSGQPVPTLANEGGTTEVRQRRYVRREQKAGGGEAS
jgi:hypothetical protein